MEAYPLPLKDWPSLTILLTRFPTKNRDHEKMSTFVPHAGPAADATEVDNLPFFPTYKVSDFREVMKVVDAIPTPRVVWELKRAISATNREVEKWRLAHEQDGVARLQDVPAAVYGDESELVMLYQAAVFHRAKAFLIDKARDTDLTNEGANANDFADDTIEHHFRQVREALADIVGQARATIELI